MIKVSVTNFFINVFIYLFIFAATTQGLVLQICTQSQSCLRLDNRPWGGGPFILAPKCDWFFQLVLQREGKWATLASPAHLIRVGCSKTKQSKSHPAQIQLLEQNPQEEERVGHGEKSALARLRHIDDIGFFIYKRRRKPRGLKEESEKDQIIPVHRDTQKAVL